MKPHKSHSRGNAFLETLIVLVVLGLTLVVAAPIVVDRVRTTRIRVAADQLAIDLRNARLAAVKSRQSVSVTVSVAGDSYEYTDGRGILRRIELPDGVDIISSSSPITFAPNGSVVGGASTTFEQELSGGHKEQRIVNVNSIGSTQIKTVQL